MGQALSEPVRDKATEVGNDHEYVYGTSSMQGWRVTMEDSHACILDMRKVNEYTGPSDAEQPDKWEDEGSAVGSPDADSSNQFEKQSESGDNTEPLISTPEELTGEKAAFFSVYDGHGGTSAAIFSGNCLHRVLATTPAYKDGKYTVALRDAFLQADRLIQSDPECSAKPSGCTATVAMLLKERIYVANAGDSRIIISMNGRAKPLSFDHKPTDPGETARVEQAGGTVKDGRVNEHLALSRAFGDFNFKNDTVRPESQPVSIFPDVTSQKVNSSIEFVVLACDGIWDCKTSQEVVDFVRRGIAAKTPLGKICEDLMEDCLAQEFDPSRVGCDNMTVTIVGLLQGKSVEEWYESVGAKVPPMEPMTVAFDSSVTKAVEAEAAVAA